MTKLEAKRQSVPCFSLACAKPSTWVRYTQFSGDHYFCDEHAKLEEDFGKQDDSYFVWQKCADAR